MNRWIARQGLFWAAIIVSGLAQAGVTVRNDGRYVTHEVTVDAFDNGRDGLNIVGIDNKFKGQNAEVGAPNLPVIRFYVYGDSADIVVDQTQTQSLNVVTPVTPVVGPRWKVPGADVEPFANPAIYRRDAFYPEVNSRVTPAGSVRGQSRSLVTLYPVRYNPVTGQARTAARFVVRSVAAEDVRSTEGEVFAFVVGRQFKDSPSLAAYAALKETLGYQVTYVVYGMDVNSPDGIRDSLQTLLQDTEQPLRYALIVGDHAHVPGWSSNTITGVTDHYYRAIDTEDYASDINGPDIGVGRLSVSSEEELAAVLRKLTRYQEGRFPREDWLRNVSFLATSDTGFYRVAEGTHNYVINTYTTERGYLGDFPNPTQEGGDQLYAITHRVPSAQVRASIGAGRTIVNYSGHGSTVSWAGPSFTKADVLALTEDVSALPFVISNACVTAQFTTDSFGETWQRHEFGAIFFWGSMDNTLWDEDDILERRMFDGIFTGSKAKFGEITDYALGEVWRHYGGEGYSKYYWETYVSLGDPSMMLRTTTPSQLTLTGPRLLAVGQSTFEYVVTDVSGAPVAGASVNLALEGSPYRIRALTDANGKVQITLHDGARQPSRFSISVESANGMLLTDTLRIE